MTNLNLQIESKIDGANCYTCPLRNNKVVPFEIIPNSSYLCLGMYPATEETKSGKILSGPSGQIVRQTFAQMNIHDVSYANAIACEASEIETENEAAVNRCRPAVLKAIERANPKLVVAMGKEALISLEVYRGAIMQYHGLIETAALINRKVMQSINPAYFLHGSNSNSYSHWANSINYAIENQRNPIPYPNVKILNSVAELKEWIASVPKNQIVSIDIETQNLRLFKRILCLSASYDGKNAVVIPFPKDLRVEFNYKTTQWEPVISEESKEFYITIKDFLESKEYDFNLQNAMFDVVYFYPYGIIVNVRHDTLLQSHVVDENAFSHGLKEQCKVRFSWPEWDESLYDYLPAGKKAQREYDWDEIPKEHLYPYSGWDAAGTQLLYNSLSKDMDTNDRWVYNKVVIPTLNMFAALRYRGVRVNLSKQLDLIDDLDVELAETEEWCRKFALEYDISLYKPTSTPQTATLLYDKLNLIPPKRLGPPPKKKFDAKKITKTENRPTDKKTLERLPQLPIIQKIIKYRELTHDRAALLAVGKWTYEDYCIHPMFNLTLKTGRASANDPSVLNVKKDSPIRQIFIPRDPENYLVFEMDQKQFELRIFAAVTKAAFMIKAFIDGLDIHDYFMKMINPGLSEVEMKKGGFRTRTKNVVFGKIYNAEVFTMATSMLVSQLKEMKKNDPAKFGEISAPTIQGQFAFEKWFKELMNDAARISAEIDKICPELNIYKYMITQKLRTDGFVESVTKLKRRFPLITPSNLKHLTNQAINSPIQTTANHLNWIAMREIYDSFNMKLPNQPLYLWFSIHDSIVGEIHKNAIHLLGVLAKIMSATPAKVLGEEHPNFKEVPFDVDISIGTTWGTTVELVRNPNKINEFVEAGKNKGLSDNVIEQGKQLILARAA